MGGCISSPAQAPSGPQRRVHALYDYNARAEDDLSFKKGDILIQLDQHQENEDWWYAQHTDPKYNNQQMETEGYVPSNYVALEDTLESQDKEANIQNRRLLKVNSRVQINGEDSPAIPCEQVTQPAPFTPCSVEQTVAFIPGPQPIITSTKAPPAQAPPGHQKRVHALYDYNAWTEDDLSFKEGDILILLDQHEEDEDWCYAQHTGLQYNNQKMEGYVPRNYVALEDTQVFLGKEANIQNQRLLKVNSRVTFPVEDTPAIPCEPVTQPAPLTQCSVEQTVASIPGYITSCDCDQFYMQKFVTAQCDYNAESENELSFKKDDILILLDDAHDTDKDMLYAERTNPGFGTHRKKGYVPRVYISDDLESQSWFHGKLSKQDAESKLKAQNIDVGAFLIRESENNPGSYAVSFRVFEETEMYPHSVGHILIKVSEDGIMNTLKKRFRSLIGFVLYVSKNKVSLSKNNQSYQVQLTTPYPKYGVIHNTYVQRSEQLMGEQRVAEHCKGFVTAKQNGELQRGSDDSKEEESAMEVLSRTKLVAIVVKRELHDGRLINLNIKMIKELKIQNVWILNEDLQGAFGNVYISREEVQGFNIRVVLKEIDIGQKQSHKTQKLGSVTNEKLASRLMHFGIVPLLAFHDDHKNGKYYFVSPFLVNGDLFDVIQCDTYYIRNNMQVKLKWEKRVKIMYQIASALDYMHAGNKFRGTILHMDIKSKNIVLDSKFNARLIDFGLSRELKEGDESLAVTALPLGTKGYYPTMQHNMLTKQHDYHNFGVVILELITGLEACTTDQGLELRKWNLRRIKDRQQDEVWIITGIVEQLSNIALECIASVSSTCKKPITSNIVLSRLTEVVRKNSVSKWEALNDGRCEVCLVNLQSKDGVDGHDFDAGDCSERIRAVDCSERIRTCCACMRNSFINPIICHTCGNTIKPFINESWGAILLSGYDKTDGEGCEEGANVFHTEIVKFKDVITSKVLPAMCLSEENVIIVPRDDANSRQTIANQIDEAFTVLAQKDIQTLLFVYSGHNNMDQGFQIDKNEYYPIRSLRTRLNTLKQSGGKLEKVIALIDCCEPEWLDLDKSIKVIQLNATGQTEEAGATRSQGSHFLSYIIQAFTASANGGKCKHPGCACIEHLKPGFITVEHLWNYVDEHRKNGHMIGNGSSKNMQGIDWKNTIIAYNYDFEVQFKFTIVWPSTSIEVPACVSPNMCTSFVALKEILADEVIKHVYGFNTNDCGIKSELADILSIEIDTGPRVYNVEEIDNEEKLLLAWNSKRMLRCTPRRLHNIDTTKPVGLFLKDCKDVQTKHLECSIQQPFSLKDLERFKNMLEQMETNSLEKSLKEYTDALDVIIHRKKEKQLQDNDLQVSFFDLPENYTFVYMKFVQKLSVVST